MAIPSVFRDSPSLLLSAAGLQDPLEHVDLAPSNPAEVARMLSIFHSYDDQHHPPVAPPPVNASACCAASALRGGYLGPWFP